jgi:4-hydroxyproline epimerase
MSKHIFECIDAHTCGNPIRLIKSGGPKLEGKTMLDKREHFMAEYNWILRSLMFEPRGHDIMSGSFLYEPSSDEFDIGILFIETSGCLPMCGHGTIGTVTMMIQEGLVKPKTEGVVVLETPAGRVDAYYTLKDNKVSSVKIINIPSFLYASNLEIISSHLGKINIDVSYGGNFYAIVDIQKNFPGIDSFTAGDLGAFSREIRIKINEQYKFEHPEDSRINKCIHVLWSGKPTKPESTARNAVFYGEKAIDRSPCGTGTSARMAQWYNQDKMNKDDIFIHESIIGSQFTGRIEKVVNVADYEAIIPSIEGWAKVYGYNKIIVDSDDDPYAHGFQVI